MICDDVSCNFNEKNLDNYNMKKGGVGKLLVCVLARNNENVLAIS